MLPFIRILPPVVVGVLLGNLFPDVTWRVTVAALAVCLAATWLLRRKRWGGAMAALSLLLFAAAMTDATRTRDVMPKGERLMMTMQVNDNPEVSGRWRRVAAVVDKFQDAEARLYDTKMPWRRSGEKVVVRFDTSHHIGAGDRLIVTGRTAALGTEEYDGYVRLMRRRGFSAAVWVGEWEQVTVLPDKARNPAVLAARMQATAAERFDRLNLPPDVAGVAKAMSIGSRGYLDGDTRAAYSQTGTSHLLAVSGLHVGIVAMLVNLLLYLLPFFRWGHILKNVAAVAAIWLYAMMTGLSPSVLRAAMMFTGAQLALASSREGGGLNIMLGTAAVMLLINPDYLYDISFQLSFMAVAGIFVLYRPLFAVVRTRFRVVNALLGVFVVGVAASLATAPLVSYYFGQIPLIGIVANPLVILTATVTVLFTVLWVIAPVGALNGFFSTVIGGAAGLQNRIVEFCSTQSWAALPVRLDAWQVAAVYALGAAIWYLVRYGLSSRSRKDKLA